MAIGGVVDDKIQAGPILRGLADVADIGVGQQLRKLLGDGGCEQTLVDADVPDPGALESFVGRIHQRLVVQPPGIVAGVLVGVVADGVALPAVGLQSGDGVVDAVQPAGLTGDDGVVREQPAGTGLLVDPVAGLENHLVGQEPVVRNVGWRIGQQSDLGIAVEKHFLEVIVELQVGDGLFLASKFGVPAGFADRGAHGDEVGQPGVVAQEMGMGVEHVLALQRDGAFVGHLRSGGLGFGDREQLAVDLVHRQEGGGHAGCGLKEAAAADALAPGQTVAHFGQPVLDLLCLRGLAFGEIFVAGYDLRGYRKTVRQILGRRQLGAFFVAEKAHGAVP